MRIFILALLFSVSAHAKMSHVEAYNMVHGVMVGLKLNAAQHDKAAEALGLLKGLVAERVEKDKAEAEKKEKDAIIKKYLEEEKKDG